MDEPIVDGLRRARLGQDPAPRSVPDPDGVAAALLSRTAALGSPADLAPRAAAAREVVAVGLGCARPDLELEGRLRLADVLAVTGERPALLDELVVVRELAERLGPRAQGRAEMIAAAQALFDGRFEECSSRVARARALSSPGSDVAYLEPVTAFAVARLTGRDLAGVVARVEALVSGMPFAARGWLALAHLAAGDRAAAARLWQSLRPHATALPPTAAEFLVAAAGNAELAVWLDDAGTAEALHALLLPWSELLVTASAAAPCEGPVDLVLGRLAHALGRRAQAREHLEQALERCRSLHAVPHEALVQAELAQLAAPGTRARLDAAGEATAIARRLGMAPLLQSLPEQPRGTGAVLTAREREVAALVAQGLSNAEVARRLHLSERTVENHVRNALTKIDGTSRTSLAVWHVASTAPR